MTQKEFARHMEMTLRHWAYVLAGRRNLSFAKAQKAAELLGTTVCLWMDPQATAKERMAAWEEFQKRHAVAPGRH